MSIKKLIPLILVSTSVAAQDRVFNYTVTQTIEAKITNERNYKESFGLDRFGKDICIVDFEAEVDGTWHTAHGEHALNNQNTGCKSAAMLARKNLTTSIKPSTITSKAELKYEENQYAKHIDGYKKGEQVDVNVLVGRVDYQKDFKHQGTICRWFYDVKRGEKGIKQYNLIACKLNAGWVVEDTF